MGNTIEGRYRKGVIIITSQVPPDGWWGLFEDSIIGEAITHRFKNPRDLIELSADSYQKNLNQ